MAVQRDLPSTTNADSTSTVVTPSRTGSYLEAFTLPLGGGANYAYADEGSLFTCVNATVGTGIAGHAAPVVADTDTKSLFHLYNSSTSSKNIIPLWLRLEFTAIGAGGTISYNVVYVDKGPATARASGGTAITPANVRPDITTSTNATVYFGAVVTSGTTGTKVWAAQCREVIPVVNDTMVISFGAPYSGPMAGITTAGTATAEIAQVAPAISIPPGGNFKFVRTRASQSGADSYAFSFAYLER